MARVNKKYREDAKERIIAAAIDVVVERGWNAMTLDTIAQNIGVTTPALYSYFRNRDALQDEVIIKVLQYNQADLVAILADDRDIRQIIQDYADRLFIHKARYANILSDLPPKSLYDPKQRERIALFFINYSGIIRDCLVRAQSRGEIPQRVNLDNAARTIIVITIGLQISSVFIGNVDMTREKELWVEAVERILLLG